ncbi:unnamed protein product [Coffea canephora]|uniref:DH200=94 genomic scaffold, scaffold_1753 n=1 Tax=Coffea canephora TaxID=49390 RepID=A0A068VJA7_COFCA|nr:unnamed protein product [Coffea canephora]
MVISQLHSHPESLFLYLNTLVEVHTTKNLKFSCLRKYVSLHFPSGRMAKHQSDRIKMFLEELNDFLKLLRSKPIQLTDEVTEQYLEVSISSTVDEVLERMDLSPCHLSSYRVENCLRLYQEYGIVDAASFLLERVGDVGSALMLILSGLNEKFNVLQASIISLVFQLLF